MHFWISVAVSGQGGSGCLFANIVDTNQVFHFVISQAGLLNTSDWQHVALTYDQSSGMARLFLNGVNVASANVGSFTPLTMSDLYLGHRPGPELLSLFRPDGRADDLQPGTDGERDFQHI